MDWAEWLIEWLVAFGHITIWIGIFNQMHATGIPRWSKKLGERVIYVCLLGVGLFVWGSDLVYYSTGWKHLVSCDPWERIAIGLGISLPAWMAQGVTFNAVMAYRILCLVAFSVIVLRWMYWRWSLRTPVEFALGPAVRHAVRLEPSHAAIERLGPVLLHGSLEDGPEARSTVSDTTVVEMGGFDSFRGDESKQVDESFDSALGDGAVSAWCGDRLTQWMSRFPGNQILELEVNAKSLYLPTLPSQFDGLSIAHVSDFHLTGRMTRRFYERVSELVSSLDCDVVVLAGDIIDKAHCLDWLGPIFQPVRAREAKLFVLGNHDKRITNEADIRKRMVSAGWLDVAGQWWLQEQAGAVIAWSGNELPWYGGARDLPVRERMPDEARVLVAHSPDQIDYGVARDFDLVLAGHTHGGQIRPPVIGPVISPSHYGPKFASGEFRVGRTYMHVSRGVAGTHVVRLNCRPEITRLVLRCGRS